MFEFESDSRETVYKCEIMQAISHEKRCTTMLARFNNFVELNLSSLSIAVTRYCPFTYSSRMSYDYAYLLGHSGLALRIITRGDVA